ncbi:MAG: carboxypeptidase-like regulatory domain-containing protein [Gemmatimonadaceae bacterium]|nr:carboxypeptidase-like regulatory domain-containing protein [Gemmatimonadaceae bacterium]
MIGSNGKRWLAAGAFALAGPLHAQLLRGTARDEQTERPLVGVRITALGARDSTLAEALTDSAGRFRLNVYAGGAPFRLMARRIGLQVVRTEPVSAAPSDTLTFDLMIAAVAVGLDTQRVLGALSKNELALADARRRGWEVISPEVIAGARNRANSVMDLLRDAGIAGLVPPRRDGDCIRTARSGSRCLVLVVDGLLQGANPYLDPRAVYFIALVPGSQATALWGPRALGGAIVVQTRNFADQVKR